MSYQGDYSEDGTLDFKFTSRNNYSEPTTLSGSPSLTIYKANGTTETTVGITLTTDFDGITGLNHVRVDLSADAFYATGQDYQIVIAAGTVGGTSVVGEVIGTFSIENRNILTAAEVNAEVLDVMNTDTLIDGKTMVEFMKIVGAILAGKITDAGTGTETFKGLDGSTTRVTVTVDVDGNRTAVVYS